MQKRLIQLFLAVAFCLVYSRSVSQKATDDPIEGTWKGTSVCQLKDSPCNDEIAVYHAIKIPGQKSYKFQMNKMVNGKEEEMGPLVFIYDDTSKTLTAVNEARNGSKSFWKFIVKDKTMHGTLIINGNTLYRLIDLRKD
jgi:hypothetical protein